MTRRALYLSHIHKLEKRTSEGEDEQALRGRAHRCRGLQGPPPEPKFLVGYNLNLAKRALSCKITFISRNERKLLNCLDLARWVKFCTSKLITRDEASPEIFDRRSFGMNKIIIGLVRYAQGLKYPIIIKKNFIVVKRGSLSCALSALNNRQKFRVKSLLISRDKLYLTRFRLSREITFIALD